MKNKIAWVIIAIMFILFSVSFVGFFYCAEKLGYCMRENNARDFERAVDCFELKNLDVGTNLP